MSQSPTGVPKDVVRQIYQAFDRITPDFSLMVGNSMILSSHLAQMAEGFDPKLAELVRDMIKALAAMRDHARSVVRG